MDLLLTEEEKLLQATVRDFVDRELVPRARELDETESFPWENVKGLGELGLMGLTVDEAYGGAGAGYQQLAIAGEEVARGCASTSVVQMAHLSLGVSTIANGGNEEQKMKYLPDLAAGRKIAAFGLTEPSSGSDAADMQTTATPRDGGYVLNGSKIFITNGVEAEVIVVFVSCLCSCLAYYNRSKTWTFGHSALWL